MISAGIIQCEDVEWPRVRMLDQNKKDIFPIIINIVTWHIYITIQKVGVGKFFFNKQSWIYLTNIVKY